MSGIYQYCLEPDCDYTSEWHGGSAGDDPSIAHLTVHPDHKVRSGVSERHQRLYRQQRDGELDVTEEYISENE